jgi:hypothetical protein
MNELLTRLLTRNLGGEQPPPGAIQPRPLVRFETVDGVAGTRVPSLTEPEPNEPVHTAPANPEAKLPSAPHLAPDAVPIHDQLPARRQAAVREEMSIRPAETEPGEEAARFADILQIQSQREPHSTPPDAAHDDRLIVEPERPDTGAFQRPAPVIVRVESVERLAPGLPVSPSDIPTRQTETTRMTQALRPEVRVTIGRIEVNVPPPSPPARPSPARRPPAPIRPVRSLDDYLRRRNEGKR